MYFSFWRLGSPRSRCWRGSFPRLFSWFEGGHWPGVCSRDLFFVCHGECSLVSPLIWTQVLSHPSPTLVTSLNLLLGPDTLQGTVLDS